MKYEKYTPTPLHEQIIEEWKKTKIVHPSYQDIADKAGCSKQTVSQVINRLQRNLIQGYENSDTGRQTVRKQKKNN